MKVYSKESLELLRSRINLIEVLSPFVHFSKSGAYYKACCPFHNEKTPSFMVQANDTHYHCFGCNAHGDAIAFLMNYQKMSFSEAVEYLAEKYSITLEHALDDTKSNEPSRKKLKEILNEATRFYHYLLMNSTEGRDALKYLYQRGIDNDFIKTFQLGLSLKDNHILQNYLFDKKIDFELLYQIGLVKNTEKHPDFFSERIMFPIRDYLGNTIGFSARKYLTDTFGPKYINTPETLLFKKSKILFGLNYSRRSIAKQKKAIIVEGQIDALRLIHNGFCITVASQGTAFTKEHVKELINLGISQIYICFDSDTAGREAAIKTGDLFQNEAIDTYVVNLPESIDPDKILIEFGPKFFERLLLESKDYLTFLIDFFLKKINPKTPAGKNELVNTVANRIKKWNQPLLVHESLKKLASITNTPGNIIESKFGVYEKIPAAVNGNLNINPDLILESDFLGMLFLGMQANFNFFKIAKKNITYEHFKNDICKTIYKKYIEYVSNNPNGDLLSFTIELKHLEQRAFLSELLQKKINLDRASETFVFIIQKILDRSWMEKREEITNKIQSKDISSEKQFEYAQLFDEIINNRPKVSL